MRRLYLIGAFVGWAGAGITAYHYFEYGSLIHTRPMRQGPSVIAQAVLFAIMGGYMAYLWWKSPPSE